MKLFIILLSIFLFSLGAFAVEEGQKERTFKLLEGNLIVVFANGPELKKYGKGGGSASGSSSEEKEEANRADLPKDWTRIWNMAKLKIVLDGAANELMRLNGSGQSQMDDPDIIVGDLDSINPTTKQFYGGRGGNVQLINVQDEHKTDLEKAIDIIAEKVQNGSKEYEGILLLGPIHGRFDLTMCTLHGMVMHAIKCPDIPIMALDGVNFIVVIPAGQTKLELKTMEYTGKSGILPMRQRATKVFTRGFQWNLGNKQGEQQNEPEAIEFGTKLSCSNKIQSPNDLLVNTNEPVLFTMELKKPNCVLSKQGKKE